MDGGSKPGPDAGAVPGALSCGCEGGAPACALCHALKDAGAEGAIGPSLDELKPDAARVAKAMKNGIGQMPAFTQLSDAQVEALSRYVEAASRK